MPTTSEVAARVGCSQETVRRLCARGELLGSYRRGRDWWIPDVAVQRLLTERASSRIPERKSS